MPFDNASTDPTFGAAFEILDDAISDKRTYLSRRLAYIELIRLSNELQRIVRSKRDRGLFRPSGLGDASVVIKIYKAAFASSLTSEQVQRTVCERRRTGRRCNGHIEAVVSRIVAYSSCQDSLIQTMRSKEEKYVLALGLALI